MENDKIIKYICYEDRIGWTVYDSEFGKFYSTLNILAASEATEKDWRLKMKGKDYRLFPISEIK